MSLTAFIVKREYSIHDNEKSERVSYVSRPLGASGSESESILIEDAHVFTNYDFYIHEVYQHNVKENKEHRGMNDSYIQTRINLVPEVK